MFDHDVNYAKIIVGSQCLGYIRDLEGSNMYVKRWIIFQLNQELSQNDFERGKGCTGIC